MVFNRARSDALQCTAGVPPATRALQPPRGQCSRPPCAPPASISAFISSTDISLPAGDFTSASQVPSFKHSHNEPQIDHHYQPAFIDMNSPPHETTMNPHQLAKSKPNNSPPTPPPPPLISVEPLLRGPMNVIPSVSEPHRRRARRGPELSFSNFAGAGSAAGFARALRSHLGKPWQGGEWITQGYLR